MCRDWIRRFKDGDFDVDDRPREERPKTFEAADVIYYELLKLKKTITGERYRTLPKPLKPTWKRSDEKSYPTRRIPQILHRPIIYYLSQSMAHGLAYQQFRSYEDIEKWLHSWIASKDEHFYRNGIQALP